ncbi:MAG: MBL fold metallo-hydrolase [Proteobacteria bacterium]|nr:MBL fold metallo-hydrolase [Pseudomonadota bacterium]
MNRAFRFLIPLIAMAGSAAAAEPRDLPRNAPVVAVEVAAGVYMVQGASGEVDTGNLGRIGNAGFIVGESGVVAIDTGTSYRHGLALLALIRRVTDKPVLLALITHTRQEFLFGATAYREQGIPIHMHRKAAGLMRSRCERCLKTLNQVLGIDAMQGTEMFKPDHEFDQSHSIDSIGRRVRVLYYGHSSGPGDVAVLDAQTGVLFAGGLLDHLRIPDVQDSDLAGWTGALQSLRALPLKVIVPGHGPVASARVIDSVDRYLTQLQARLLESLRSGAALSEVPDAAALPEFALWDQYETIHRRNASILFVRFEREQMFKQTGTQE